MEVNSRTSINKISLTGFGWIRIGLATYSSVDNTGSFVENDINFPSSENRGILNDSDVIKYLLAPICVMASACLNPKVVRDVCVLLPENTSLPVKFSLRQTKGCNVEL